MVPTATPVSRCAPAGELTSSSCFLTKQGRDLGHITSLGFDWLYCLSSENKMYLPEGRGIDTKLDFPPAFASKIFGSN